MRHYNPHDYSDDDRSDGIYYSSESPDETDSEYDDYRERGGGANCGYHVSDDRGVVCVPASDSPSEGGIPDSESETETDDYSDRYSPEDYESGSTHDRDDHDSHGDSYDGWDDVDDDEYGDYDGAPILPSCSHTFRYPACSCPPCARRRLFRLLLLDIGCKEAQSD